MKNFTLSLLLIFGCSLILQAQEPIIITSDDFSPSLDVTYTWKRISNPTTEIPAGGENMYWDYRELQGGVNTWQNHAPENNPEFPTAFRKMVGQSAVGSVMIPLDWHEELIESGYSWIGTTVTETLIPLTQITGGPNDNLFFPAQSQMYEHKDNHIKMPLTMGTQWSYESTFVSDFTITIAAYGLNNVPCQQKQYMTYDREIIGWGVITIPYDGAPSKPYEVLLLKSNRNVRDSVFMNGAPMPDAMLQQFGIQQGQNTDLVLYEFLHKEDLQNILNSRSNTEAGPMFEISYATAEFVKENNAPTAADYTPANLQNGTAFSFSIATAFTDLDVADSFSYTATLADGSSLPAWINFEEATGIFSGTPTEIGSIEIEISATDLAGETATQTITINVTAGESVINPELVENAVFPNPTNGIINFNMKNINRVEIFSIDGKLIRALFLQEDANQISVKDLDNGIYILSLYSGKTNYKTKIQIIK